MENDNSNTKSFFLGALIGGAIGAVAALLLAPKSGKELRRDIVDTTTDAYDKATDYVSSTIEEGKHKAQHIIDAAKRQADHILAKTGDYNDDANLKIAASSYTVRQRFDYLKETAKAGLDAFKTASSLFFAFWDYSKKLFNARKEILEIKERNKNQLILYEKTKPKMEIINTKKNNIK
jgi:gas vesicle protein